MDFFKTNYRVVTVDLPGFGKSGKNRNDWSVEEYGKDITALIAQLNLKNVILIGHSMSGAIVVEAAGRNTENVIGIVGIDNFKDIAWVPTPQSKQEMEQFYKSAAASYKQTVTAFASQSLFAPQTDSASKKRVLQDFANADSIIAINVIKAGDNYPLNTKLTALKRKLFLVNSDYTPTDTMAFKKQRIPYALYTIHSTNHYPMIEKPKAFNELLQQAVNEVVAESKK